MPPGVVTATSTRPAACAGVGQVIEVPAMVQDAKVADVPPKLTSVAPVKSVLVMVTLVPPAVGPMFGETFVMACVAAPNGVPVS